LIRYNSLILIVLFLSKKIKKILDKFFISWYALLSLEKREKEVEDIVKNTKSVIDTYS